jgi:hypothetical protein
MLKAHSLLWHYLWLAPNVLLAALALFFWRSDLRKRFPAFFAYALLQSAQVFILYTIDILPSASAETYWRAFWAGTIIEGLIRFAVIGELLRHLLHSWPALAKTGYRLLTWMGGLLVLLAAGAAVLTTPENPHWLVGGAILLTQTLYIIQCGLVLFLFGFAAYFELQWDPVSFGIVLGLGILFCERVASWAVLAGIDSPSRSVVLTFINMGTYHLCVLIWCYYLLVPHKSAITSAAALPENNLAAWNRELERLLQP